MRLVNIFFRLFETFDSMVLAGGCADENDCLGVPVGGLPAGVKKQGLGQGRAGGNQDGLNVPVIENLLPALVKLSHRLNALAQQVVAIEVGAAVGEDAVLRVEFPDGIAAPVVESEEALRLGRGPEE